MYSVFKKLKNRHLKDVGIISLATIVSKGLNFFKDFLLASLLGPAIYGIWVEILLILNYSLHLPVGFQHLLGREIPYMEAKKDHSGISKLFNSTIFTFLVIYAFFSIIFIHFKGFGILIDTEVLLLLLVLILIYNFQAVLSISIRAFQLFQAFSLSSIAYSIILLLSTWLFVLKIGIEGALLAMIFTSTALTIYWMKILPLEKKIKIIIPSRKNSIESFDLFSIGILGILSLSLDRLIMIAYYDEKSVGIYGMAFLFNQMVFLVITPINQTIIPKLNFDYGEGGNFRSIKKYFNFLSQGTPLLVCFLISLLYYSVEFLIHQFLPAYIESIVLIKISLIGSVFLTISNGVISFLTAIKKQRSILKNQFTIIIIQTILFLTVSISSLELKFISLAYTISLIIYSILNYSSVLNQIKKIGKVTNREGAITYLIITITILLLIIIDECILLESIFIEILVKTSLIIALWFVIAMVCGRKFFKKLFLI